MKFLIHFERPNGSEDSIVITGATLEEIRRKAEAEIEARNGINSWSEELK